MPLGIEIYQGKPIFYGLGGFAFETGHRGRRHADRVGLMLHVTVAEAAVLCAVAAKPAALEQLRRLSRRFGTTLEVEGDAVVAYCRAG